MTKIKMEMIEKNKTTIYIWNNKHFQKHILEIIDTKLINKL